VSLFITYQSNKENEQQLKNLSETLGNTSFLRSQIDSLESISKSHLERIASLEGELKAYQTILAQIREESMRQPQHVMAQYVRIRSNDFWEAPNLIYPGSIVKFYGFRNYLMVIYGDRINLNRYELTMIADEIRHSLDYTHSDLYDQRMLDRVFGSNVRYQIVMPNMTEHSEIAIIGEGGSSKRWAILNLSDTECDGKVYVESTPRIRSTDWSWIEERVNRDGSLKKIQNEY
jgi:hypothetical protein